MDGSLSGSSPDDAGRGEAFRGLRSLDRFVFVLVPGLMDDDFSEEVSLSEAMEDDSSAGASLPKTMGGGFVGEGSLSGTIDETIF